jgi:predicted metal-dependent phosphoesterase TrpH
MQVDLHTHTSASDGQHTPSDLIRLARAFHIIAITDHDTTEGIAEAKAAAAAQGAPQIISGIELSAEAIGGDVHMLGYFIDIDNAALQSALRAFRETRFYRGQRIVEKLGALGVPVEWARVEALAGGGAVGRPHIARALIEAGHVETVREAFERYIANGAPAYVARQRLSPEEAVALIHSAGGVAVLAHPGALRDHVGMVRRLIPAGLDGVEVAHPTNDAGVRADLRGLARQFDLVMTGGSDFHGLALKPDQPLGCETPPEGAVARLRERAARYQAAC